MTITELKNLSKDELLSYISELNNSIDSIKQNFFEVLEIKEATIKELTKIDNLITLYKDNDLFVWNSEEENNVNTLCEGTGILIYAEDLKKIISH